MHLRSKAREFTLQRAADLLIHHLHGHLSLLELQSLRATCKALRVAVHGAESRIGLTVARWACLRLCLPAHPKRKSGVSDSHSQCRNTLPADHPLCLHSTTESWLQRTDQLARLHCALRTGRPAKVAALEVQPSAQLCKLWSVLDPTGGHLDALWPCLRSAAPMFGLSAYETCSSVCSSYLAASISRFQS